MNNAQQKPRRPFVPPTKEETDRMIDRDLAIAESAVQVNVDYAKKLILKEREDREFVFDALMMRTNSHHAATLYLKLAEFAIFGKTNR